jgi:hypothetical protein
VAAGGQPDPADLGFHGRAPVRSSWPPDHDASEEDRAAVGVKWRRRFRSWCQPSSFFGAAPRPFVDEAHRCGVKVLIQVGSIGTVPRYRQLRAAIPNLQFGC